MNLWLHRPWLLGANKIRKHLNRISIDGKKIFQYHGWVLQRNRSDQAVTFFPQYPKCADSKHSCVSYSIHLHYSAMSLGLEIRDPIHGFIYREPKEKKIVDTKVFQRLRLLKQLALASLVYPGAVHSRFDHSLGAFHIARELSNRLLTSSESDRELVRLAALLHDIGHGPFSHVSEPILQRFSSVKHDTDKQQIHEIISSKIIETNPELIRILGEDQCHDITRLMSGKYGYRVLKDIVSGPLDVDKQDYLLRDSYFCGVKYGVFDLHRLIDTLRVHKDADEEQYLAISADGINSVEQFVLAKYYMSVQVYFHRIRLITDEMIARGITLGIEEDEIGWLKTLYTFDGSAAHLEEYLEWHDEKLILEILSDRTPDGFAKQIFTRLRNRNLLKCIFSASENEFETVTPEIRHAIFIDSINICRTLEETVADTYKYDKNYVIAKIVKFRPATRTESEIMVLHPAQPTPFHEASTLFASVDEAIKEQRIEVYAPASYEERDKKKQQRDFHNQIFEMIIKLAHPQEKLELGK
jgi:HD superfamily phosphohydrolase